MTIVHRRHRFIYLKSHKTASTSIEMFLIRETELGSDAFATSKDIRKHGFPRKQRSHAFFPWWRRLTQHASAAEVRQVVGRPLWNTCVKTSSLRNPWDMLVSQYEWERSGRAGRSAPIAAAWDEWLEQALTPGHDQTPSKAESKIFPHAFIEGHYVLDHMIFFEDLDGSMSALAQKTGVDMPPFSSRNINEKRTRHDRDYRRYYSPVQVDAVGRAFAPLLALFPYAFERPGEPPQGQPS